MTDNKDIAVLAKKVYELSVLPVEALDARKWEALLILNAVYSSATPEGIDKANADKAARWGAAIEQEGLLSRMHPKVAPAHRRRQAAGRPPSPSSRPSRTRPGPSRATGHPAIHRPRRSPPARRPRPRPDLRRLQRRDRRGPQPSTSTSRAPAARTGFASPGRSCSRRRRAAARDAPDRQPGRDPRRRHLRRSRRRHGPGTASAGRTRSAPGTSTSSATTRSPALHGDRDRRRQGRRDRRPGRRGRQRCREGHRHPAQVGPVCPRGHRRHRCHRGRARRGEPPAPSPTQHVDDDDPIDASAPQADLDDAPESAADRGRSAGCGPRNSS
jgi:hypothetical protein